MKNNVSLVGSIILVVVVLLISLGLTYLIATSNLPDWLKWFLLRYGG